MERMFCGVGWERNENGRGLVETEMKSVGTGVICVPVQSLILSRRSVQFSNFYSGLSDKHHHKDHAHSSAPFCRTSAYLTNADDGSRNPT